MLNKALTLDTETWDPTLLKFSSGAVLNYHFPEITFTVLGAGIIDSQGKEEYFNFVPPHNKDLKAGLLNVLSQHNTLIMHNALYDMACLKNVYRDNIDFTKFTIIDTMLLAKLWDQYLDRKITFSHSPYSLDTLSKYLNLAERKESDGLHDYAWMSGLYQQSHLEITGRKAHTRPSAAVLDKWCKTNMQVFPSEIIAEYCLQDVRATKSLYGKLTDLSEQAHEVIGMLSDILKIALKMKFRGVHIDLNETNKLSLRWKQIAKEAEANVRKEFGQEINIRSVAQIAPMLEKKGMIIPKTEKGNYSITADWLDEQSAPLLKDLKRYRKAVKAEKDFIQKIIQYQEIIPDKYKTPGVGVMFPSFKPLGATVTGRFSSGGGAGSLELNMLAISSHDEEFGAPIRKLFIANVGHKLVCCDISNQEPRLQAHYANLLGCDGIKPVIEEWNRNPTMKYHKKIQEMTGLDYDVAKMVTLGLAYDMRAFGLSVKLGISYPDAEALIAKYFKLVPYMQQLQQICSASIAKNGYIKTIGGRKLIIEPPSEFKGKIRTKERKAMSQLIQGSGADQLMQAMIKIDKAGMDLVLCVHDELVIETQQPEQDLERMKECIATAYTISVPVVSEGGYAGSWGDAKK